jgi:hypothetical protein
MEVGFLDRQRSVAQAAAAAAVEREDRAARGRQRVRAIAVAEQRQEPPPTMTDSTAAEDICRAAASLGRLTRLPEHTVEAFGRKVATAL